MDSNKKKRRRVLMASCIMAALIIGGSTFAWFTSRDDVVNKLSATSNYDVVTVEDFTPPSNWVPGQEVDKDVRVTNTGNVDAFVKSTITGDLVLTKLIASNTVSEDSLAKAIKLSTTPTPQANPDTPAASADEVIAKQAGGRLVYSPATDGYSNEAIEAGTKVAETQNGTLIDSGNYAKDQIGFTVEQDKAGYYIFARSTEQFDRNGTTTKVTYDGYYYDGSSYYDIEITPDADDIYKVTAKLRQKETTTVANDKFTYSLNDDGDILYAVYDPDNSLNKVYPITNKLDNDGNPTDEKTGTLTGDEIIIDIALVNVGTTGDTWTSHVTEPASPVGTTGEATAFYYNKILAAGTTTSDFITSVTLNENVTNNAFLALDYNLKVTVQSAQVTEGTYKYTAVNAQDWANTSGTKKVSSVDGSNNVTWVDNETTTP